MTPQLKMPNPLHLSYSGQQAGWHDYPAATWQTRKPLDWLDDWPFWEYCAQTYAGTGPVLELACGNGRITRQLALAGWPVVAVDLNPHFLNRAQQAIQALPDDQLAPVDFYLQDVVYLDIDHPPFQLAIMADWAFPALLTQDDQHRFMTRLAAHLRPDGIFAFNTPFASAQQIGLEVAPDDQTLHWPGQARTFDPVTQIETRHDGPRPLKFRHTTLGEIKWLAALTGFAVREVYGGTDRRPLHGLPGDDLTLVLQRHTNSC